MVEFALAFPILLLVIIGLIDFGRVIFAYNAVSNAARTGARVAIVDQNKTVIEQAALAETVGLDAVVIEHQACATLDCLYGLTVREAFTPATPIISSLIGPITVESTARMPVEREYASP